MTFSMKILVGVVVVLAAFVVWLWIWGIKQDVDEEYLERMEKELREEDDFNEYRR